MKLNVNKIITYMYSFLVYVIFFSIRTPLFQEIIHFLHWPWFSFGSFNCIGCFSVQLQLLIKRSRAATLALSSSFSDIGLLSRFSSLFVKSSRVYPVIPFGMKRHNHRIDNPDDIFGVQYEILCVD